MQQRRRAMHGDGAAARGLAALPRRRFVGVLFALAGSWKFWAGTALAAGIVGGVALAVYKTVWAEPGDAGSYAYYDLQSAPADPAERIMTFNRIKTTVKGPVDYDNFTGSTTSSKNSRNWWEFYNSDPVPDFMATYNLVKGTHFTCHAKGNDGPVLWEFINCRGGNLNPTSTSGKAKDYQNLLPWSSDGYSFKSRLSAANQTTAGTLVMQNTPDAQVMSGCLKDGIGTIYFDAVNGFTGYQFARLQVEAAYGVWKTNATGRIEKPEGERKVPDDLEIAADGSFVPPDAAHADEHHTVDDGAETKTVETNVNARIAWVPVRTTGHWWCNGVDKPVAATNTVVSLKMPETGTITDHFANFYRFWAPVQDERINPDLAPYCRRPMRFRIKRNDNPTREHGNMGLDGENYKGTPEANGLIILDNIIASFPAMSLCAVPGGDYIEGGSSRNVIGWTGVFHPEGRTGKYYPKIGEKGLSVEAGIEWATNAPPGVTGEWIAGTGVKMRHWIRYLDYVSATNETAMTVGDDGRLHGSVAALPAIPGDLEYCYDAELDAPYYGYVDYTGKNAGTPGYIERIAHVTSRLNPKAIPEGGLPSTGTDFFTRLREGRSDQLEYRLEVRWKDGLEYAVTNSPFYLSADGNWRTFVKVSTNATNVTAFRPGAYEFRIVGRDPEVAYVGDAETVGAIPWSGQGLRLQSAENPESDWTAITFDGVTDALLFQLVEGNGAAPTYTIVHGSYQDFNQWTTRDSTKVPPLYVGAFEFGGRGEMSGSSPDTRDFPCELPGWLPPSADNRDFWTESFRLNSTEKPIEGWGGYRAYEPFSFCTTRQGWEAIGGMWVCSKWRESAAGGEMALQLGGGREGSLAFTNAKRLPHGIDQVAVKARVAEGADFGGFAIYDTGGSAENRNYIVSMRAVMRLNKTADDFDGNGTVSIIGYYRSGRGCYEMRAERIATDTIRMNLYKWTFENGKAKATHLGYHRNTLAMNSQSYLRMNNADIPSATSTSSYYGELFMRCQTSADEKTVTITAGLMNGAKRLMDSCSSVSHYYLVYKDTENPITYGKCGFDALNCPAQIVDYARYPDGGTFPSVNSKPYDPDGKEIPDANFRCGNGTVVYPSGRTQLFIPTSEGDDAFYKNWSYRFDKFTLKGNFASEYPGLLTEPPTGELELYETHYDATERKDIETKVDDVVKVTGFTFTNCVFNVRNTTDSSLRISTAKGSGDIVIDSASFDQWCAASYSDTDAHEFDERKSLACPENYVYLNGTVVSNADEHIIRLQPMRARTDVVSIRAPLMDGGNDDRYGAKEMQRGLGLGILSYTYRNADSNCVIIAQYKEIEGSNELKNPTDSSEGWIDVATNDFSTVTPEARRIGETVVVPFAKMGKKGVMRLVLAPWLVADAQDKAKNPKSDPNWGSVEIVDFMSRDDPPVDTSCWWGWNLRTTSATSERSLYDSKPADVGMALALNEAVDKDVIKETKDLYPQHLPFVQTPDFATNVVGEISFRARRLPGAAADEYTEVAILGAKDGGAPDADWQFLTNILIKSDVYERYTYKTRTDVGDFATFRLAVIGVKNLNEGVPNYKDRMAIAEPRRVLIDEVEVTEAIRGRIRLLKVGAFKEPLEKHVYVTNLLDVVQQPMCGESWSVQCEVKKVQLPEEVVLDDATEVYFHWFTTNTSALAANWGWEKWKDKGKSAKLARIKDQPGFVYRGSYPEAGAAIVDPEKTAGTVVQYMLEVKYWNTDGSPATYCMPIGDWTKPAWYNGVDYNRSYGAGERFAAFTILDSVPYGYAYINEVNIFDDAAKGTTDNANISNQYVEVAVPVGTDITGWELQFITGGIGEGSPFYTNTVVVYTDRDRYPGVGVPGKKTKWAEDGYVFITAGNTATASGRLKSEEYVDGAWKVNAGEDHGPQILNESTGAIDGGYPLGIRLKRPSGIVEHEIVIAGTNRYAAWGPSYELRADPTNFVAKLRRQFGGSWYWTGNDTGDVPGNGRSVTAFDGVATNGSVWAHWQKTPGEINRNGAERESMPSFVPKPLSTMLMLMAKLVGEHFDQTICDYRNVTNDVVVYVPKGIGTNITYRVDDWYGVVKITEQEAGKAKREYVPENPVGGYVRFEAAKDMSNDVTVVATSGLRRDLTERYGLGPENRYTDAIMAWLVKGRWGKGGTETFKVPGGEIKPATFEGISGTVVRDLELEEMYWLDMDPTRGDLVLRAGMVTPPEKVVVKAPHIGPGQPGEVEYDREDIRLGVLMEISSRTGEFEPYAPYTLNGLKPESSSAADARNWNAVTFKIEGYLANGRDDFKEPDRIWVPLRHFVFDGESFDATTHEALIQVRDPFLMEDWKPYEDNAVYFRWNLNDNRIGAMGSETLRPDSTFDEGE